MGTDQTIPRNTHSTSSTPCTVRWLPLLNKYFKDLSLNSEVRGNYQKAVIIVPLTHGSIELWSRKPIRDAHLDVHSMVR